MNQNLDTIKSEIEQYLPAEGFVMFRGFPRISDDLPDPPIHWDSVRYPDYRPFLEAARAVGVKLVTFHHREFSAGMLEDVRQELNSADMPREDKRKIERDLKKLGDFDGLTCALELAFEHSGRLYLWTMLTPWYAELLDILDTIDDSLPEEEDDDDPMGGYFSRN
jgi:hypothetical protein